jgi:hypothetical protein
MAKPVVIMSSGGLPCVNTIGQGVPMTPSTVGMGVTLGTVGKPVSIVNLDGSPWTASWELIGTGAITPVAAGASTVSRTLPTTNGAIRHGDVVIVALACDAQFDTTRIPVDYTSIGFTGAGASPAAEAGYKRMGAVPDSAIVLNQLAGGVIAGVIQVWRGADATTQIDSVFTSTTNTTGLPNPTSITTNSANALVIAMGFLDDDDAAANAAEPTSYTNGVAGDTGQGSTTVGATVFMASRIIAAAGAENPGAWTGSAGDDAWIGGAVALKKG